MSQESWAYRIEIFWSDEDDGYIAVAPDLPGCSAFGADRIEAAREMHDAMTAWLMANQKMGRQAPVPTRSPHEKPTTQAREPTT